jgi:hypothetical protein
MVHIARHFCQTCAPIYVLIPCFLRSDLLLESGKNHQPVKWSQKMGNILITDSRMAYSAFRILLKDSVYFIPDFFILRAQLRMSPILENETQ